MECLEDDGGIGDGGLEEPVEDALPPLVVGEAGAVVDHVGVPAVDASAVLVVDVHHVGLLGVWAVVVALADLPLVALVDAVVDVRAQQRHLLVRRALEVQQHAVEGVVDVEGVLLLVVDLLKVGRHECVLA